MSDPVLDLINKQKLEFKVSGQDYLIKCLNPEHEDSNPSFRVDKLSGIAHCFSCGFKTNIFKFYGITGNFTSIKTAKLKEKLKALYINSNGVDKPEGATPFTQVFRGISIKTLKHFDAYYTHMKEELADRIFFPITDVRGKAVVHVGRHMLSSGNPRYLNYPRGATIPVFPCIFESRHTSIVLVEGIFDMLNLYDKGLKNVVCTFGTNTLQADTADKLLPYKIQGISKIYMLFDGDDAGRVAATKLKPLIEESGFSVEIITLEDDTDPGDLSQEYVDSIKEYVSEKNSNH